MSNQTDSQFLLEQITNMDEKDIIKSKLILSLIQELTELKERVEILESKS